MLMIFHVRRYLLTVVTLIVAIIWDTPLAIGAAGVATAILLDVFVSSRSKDLLLYRNDLNFAAPAQLMGWREALRLHAIAIVAAPLVGLIPRTFDGDANTQQIFSMAALLVCGFVASYCGLFKVGGPEEPRELLYRARTMTGEIGLLFGIDFLPVHPRTLAIGLVRILSGPIMMFFFLLFLGALRTVPIDLKLVLLLVGPAFLFQLGFLLLLQGLFTLRWWRRPNDVVLPPAS